MKRVCIVGCGAIGSLYAAHLARVAEVWAFVRREEHARALNRDGLRVSGKHEFRVSLKATTEPQRTSGIRLGDRGDESHAGRRRQSLKLDIVLIRAQ